MGLQGEKKLEDILTGALIGLARTTYSHLKTENTDRVVTCCLLYTSTPEYSDRSSYLPGITGHHMHSAKFCFPCR